MIKINSASTKFCLLTTQRSGSTWLNELIGSHPNIRLFSGEIFVDKPPETNLGWIDDPFFETFYTYRRKEQIKRPWITLKYIDEIDAYPEKYQAIGFHLMYDQLADYPEILFKLITNGYKIIHLERLNYLDTLISIANLRQRNIVHSRNKIEVTPIHLDIELLWNSLCRQEEKIDIIKKLLRILPLKVHYVTYESLKSDKQRYLGQISNFLNVSNLDIKFESTLKKISSGSYAEKIENFDDVYNKLMGTRYENFISQ